MYYLNPDEYKSTRLFHAVPDFSIDAIENTSNAFAGKPPIADDSNYSNQPIAHDSAKIGSHVNVPPNVGRIMDISRIEAGRL